MWKNKPHTIKTKPPSSKDPGRYKSKIMQRNLTSDDQTGSRHANAPGDICVNDQPWNLQKNVGESSVSMASIELQYSFVLPKRPMTSKVSVCKEEYLN